MCPLTDTLGEFEVQVGPLDYPDYPPHVSGRLISPIYPCEKQESCIWLPHVFQEGIQSGFKDTKRQMIHHFSGQFISKVNPSHFENVIPYFSSEFVWLQSLPSRSCCPPSLLNSLSASGIFSPRFLLPYSQSISESQSKEQALKARTELAFPSAHFALLSCKKTPPVLLHPSSASSALSIALQNCSHTPGEGCAPLAGPPKPLFAVSLWQVSPWEQ